MTNDYYSQLNNSTVEDIKNNRAFFMRQSERPIPGLYNTERSDNYIPFQSHSAKMSDFNGFVQEQCTNAINASFTKSSFRSGIPEGELERFKTTLVNEIVKNPAFMAEVTNRAYREVMDMHYQPLDRRGFIEKARDENSREFKQLNSALSAHIDDMYINKRPSFNPAFNEISKPLIINIENINRYNPKPRPAIDNSITEFVQKQMRQDKTAAILADTYAGTFIERARTASRIGKVVIAGATVAGALYTANFPAAIGITGALVSDIMTWRKVPEHYHDTHKVAINNRVFKGNELQKILNFDNAPFSLTGGGKITSRDYEIAHRAERTILGINPKINKDEYQQDIARHHIVNFCKSTAHRLNGVSENDFMKVADKITSLQELKGNHTLKSCRDNPRAFYACLNQTVRDNPQVLNDAVLQLNRNRSQRMQHSETVRRVGTMRN